MYPRNDEILIVDDDTAMRTMLAQYLTKNGYLVEEAGTAAAANTAIIKKTHSLVLLDLSLPDGDGADLAHSWRDDYAISIIFITGRTEAEDRVMGLESYADDYITKPYSLREVLARIRAVIRRSSRSVQLPLTRGKHPRAYHFSGWNLNLNTRRLISPDSRNVQLTNAEFNLLVAFLSTPGRIISRDKLLESTRAFDDIYDRAIDVQILRLRRKLETDPKHPTLLCTERGVGYFFYTEIETIWH